MIAKLSYDTRMWSRLADGEVRGIVISAGTEVRIVLETRTPQGQCYFIETPDRKYTSQQVECHSCNPPFGLTNTPIVC